MPDKLIKGRYLTFEYPVPKLTYEHGSFVTQPKFAVTISQSVREEQLVPKWDSRARAFVKEGPKHQNKLVNQKQRISGMAPGENTDKVHRNFQWLHYYGGAVNQVSYDNIDVLSGNFSGCWMMVYKKDGINRVGHVGTVDDAAHRLSIAAKKGWNEFARANPRAVVRGFNPARAWPKEKIPKKIDGDGLPRIWGLVTADKLVSIFLYRGERYEHENRYRIAGVKTVNAHHVPELCDI